MTLHTNLENIIVKYSDPKELQRKWDHDKSVGSGFYYSITYDPIKKFFNKYKYIDDHLELKIALVFSWNPKICEVNEERFDAAKSKLYQLRNVQDIINDETIKEFDINQHFQPLWNAIKHATSSTESAPGVSVAKYLHFSFPSIFPMIDINTMKILSGRGYNRNAYEEFLYAWKYLYDKYESVFKSLSSSMNMPPARILDVMIFNPK